MWCVTGWTSCWLRAFTARHTHQIRSVGFRITLSLVDGVVCVFNTFAVLIIAFVLMWMVFPMAGYHIYISLINEATFEQV